MKNHRYLLFTNEAIILSGGKYSLESACNYVKTSLCEEKTGRIAEEKRLDIIITNLTKFKMNGVEICREIKARYPNLEVLLVSGSPDELRKHLLGFLHAEARGLSRTSMVEKEVTNYHGQA